jgi:hypothetical protein
MIGLSVDGVARAQERTVRYALRQGLYHIQAHRVLAF